MRDPIETVSDLTALEHLDINAQDRMGRTILHYAALDGAIVTAKYLLQREADPEICDADGNNVFQLALLGGQVSFGARHIPHPERSVQFNQHCIVI